MNYQSDRMQLEVLQLILTNPINDISVCEDVSTLSKSRYLVIALKDHVTVKNFLCICEREKKQISDFTIDHFSYRGQFILVFPYVKERNIESFFVGEVMDLQTCEDVCRSLLIACITSNLPYPILYMVLTQKLVNLAKDNTIGFSYAMDFSKLDITKTERECVIFSARLMLVLLESKERQKADSFTLINKRCGALGYSSFKELYKDLIISSSVSRKIGIFEKINNYWNTQKDICFRIFTGVCAVVAVIALITVLMQFITGEVLWARIFINNFKQIGTESLLQ